MKWKQFLSDYLRFSKNDRIGILILLFLIASIFLLPAVIPQNKQARAMADTAWIATLKQKEIPESNENRTTAYSRYRDFNDQPDYSGSKRSNNQQGALFYFDPNSLPEEGWQRLGLRPKTIHTIQNYLAKGGHFKQPEDLQKIYGLFPDEYERLAPYIQIESGIGSSVNSVVSNTEVPAPAKTLPPRYAIIDINTADTTAFINLPGIGSKLASRIINFREKLGGFYAVSQVGETYGLADSTFQKVKQYLKMDNYSVKKININTATLDELKAHPYIRYSIANPIIAYRNEHGPFAKPEDIRKVMAVTEELYKKIAPYLVVQ